MSVRPVRREAPEGGTEPQRDAPTRNDGPAGPRAEVVDLETVIGIVEREAGRTAHERTARSIFQSATLGAVLTSLRAGGSAHNEQPDEATLIQGIRGECLISLDGQWSVIGPGTLVGIPPGVAWRLRARTDALVLLTVAPA